MSTRKIFIGTAGFLTLVLFTLSVLPQMVAGEPVSRQEGQPAPVTTSAAATAAPVAPTMPMPVGLPATTAPQPDVDSPSAPIVSTVLPELPLDALPDNPVAPTPPPGPTEEQRTNPGADLPGIPGDGRPPTRLLPCYAAPRLVNPPRFLTLPFPTDRRMEVFHGWLYTHNRHPQCGIDFGMRNEKDQLVGFPILAAADGEACADRDDTSGGCVRGFGDRVLIRHEVDGAVYYTYYGHLATIEPDIPIGSRSKTVHVKRGQVIGFAGDTGTFGGSIHLHFGIAAPSFGWYDPYDLWNVSAIYPDPMGVNSYLSGPNYFWTTNPPSSAVHPNVVGQPEASEPAHIITAGRMNVAAWTQILGRQTGTVEIWINGERRAEVVYGPSSRGEDSTFEWLWDTTRERNGPHTIRLKAKPEDSQEKAQFTATRSDEATFLIAVANPVGYVSNPRPAAIVEGTLPITGWVIVDQSKISAVEIWIDGEKRGDAVYGLPYTPENGNYGFLWEWDTRSELDGLHTIIVKVFAENGGSAELRSAYDIQQRYLVVSTENQSPGSEWVIR